PATRKRHESLPQPLSEAVCMARGGVLRATAGSWSRTSWDRRMSAPAPLQKVRTWVDQVIDDKGTLLIDVALAMLLAERADAFGIVKRQNPRRLAGQLGELLPDVVASIARLIERRHLARVPRAAGGGYHLISGNEAPRRRPQAADVIPYAAHRRH